MSINLHKKEREIRERKLVKSKGRVRLGEPILLGTVLGSERRTLWDILVVKKVSFH